MSTHPRPTPLMTTIMGLATMVAALAVTWVVTMALGVLAWRVAFAAPYKEILSVHGVFACSAIGFVVAGGMVIVLRIAYLVGETTLDFRDYIKTHPNHPAADKTGDT